MIAGPPPGPFFQLIRRWKEFMGQWMLERLSPPEVKPRQRTPVQKVGPIVEPVPAEEIVQPETTGRTSTVATLRRRSRG